jgi:hypothetical protein
MPVQWICGCSRVVLHTHDDKKETIKYMALCEECAGNDGDYRKSSAWKEDEPRDEPVGRKKFDKTKQGVRRLK